MAKRCVLVDGDFAFDRPWSEGPRLLREQTRMACACEDPAVDSEDGEDLVETLHGGLPEA